MPGSDALHNPVIATGTFYQSRKYAYLTKVKVYALCSDIDHRRDSQRLTDNGPLSPEKTIPAIFSQTKTIWCHALIIAAACLK